MSFRLKRLFRSRGSRSPSPLPTASRLTSEPSRGYSLLAAGPQDLPAQPWPPTIDPVSAATNVSAPPAPIGEGQNYGVKVLYDSGTEASVDIVFVHGLTGNAYNTWLHKDTGVHWPSELLGRDIPHARILSFGYDADIVNLWSPVSNSRLSNHAENMIGDLVRKRERTNTETRKILFVAHSLGGLVTECALNYSRNAVEKFLHQIERYTAGIIFLGVPHCGADLAAWANFGTRMVSILRRANKDIVGVLKPKSEMLRVAENDFYKILRLRKDEGSEISITCFYEELPVIGIGEVVPLHSAGIKGYSCYGIHANHMDMTKFSSRKDRGYDAILGELQRWEKSADCRENTSTGISSETNDIKKLTSGTMVEQDSNQFGHTRARNSQVVQGNFCHPVFNPKAVAGPETTEYEAANPWMVPRAASPLYTGRQELGRRLAHVLSYDPSISPIQRRTFVIVGLGGTGKSEVCLKFAEDNRDQYWGIFWVDARSIATAEQGYIDIGRRCGVAEPSVKNVKNWLANKHRWLLIIDNADDPELDYSEYLPSGSRGDILLTTRNTECVVYETVGSETLVCLEPELARILLLRAAHTTESQWGEKKQAAMGVVEILGSHTLAIIQAGAYIRKKICTLEEYPIIFQQQKQQLLKSQSKQSESTYGNVYTTFEVSAEYLQDSKRPESLDALDLLHTIAFMHNSKISEAIFKRASNQAFHLKSTGTSTDEEVLSMPVHHVTRLPEYAQHGWLNPHRLRWRKACRTLESLSIINIHEDDDSIVISVHSLVHVWAKERQDYQNRCRAWQSAATILALSCEGWYNFCPSFVFLQPHVRACVGHEISDFTKNMTDIKAAQILVQFAYVLVQMNDQSLFSFLVQRIHLRLQNRYEANREIALQIKSLTGRVSLQQERFEETVNIYREIVKDRSRTLAEDHPSRLTSQHELAVAYLANEQIDEAIKLLEHVTKIKEKLTEDHFSRLASQHELARAYLANGQIDEAMKLLKHVTKIKEKLVEDHPSRLVSQHNLARTYLENKQIDEAIKLFEYVVKIREKLAEDHFSRLTSQHELARAYLANGQINEAIKLLEHVTKIRRKLAEDRSSGLAPQHDPVVVYLANK